MLGRALLKLKFRPSIAGAPLRASRFVALSRAPLRMPAIRPMSTAVTTTDAAPTGKPDSEADGYKDSILGTGNQWYPLIGLWSAATITQEWVLMDEYIVTGTCFYFMLYSAYVLARDKVNARSARAWAHRVTVAKGTTGMYLDNLKRYELLEEFSLGHADELRNLYAEEAKINEMAVEYQNLKHKFDTRAAILQKLKAIEQLEEDTRSAAVIALSKKAAEYVTASYQSAPAAVKQRQIEAGINQIVPELSTRSIATSRSLKQGEIPADDPVKLLFDEFVSQPKTIEQLGVPNAVSRYLERQKAAAANKDKH